MNAAKEAIWKTSLKCKHIFNLNESQKNYLSIRSFHIKISNLRKLSDHILVSYFTMACTLETTISMLQHPSIQIRANLIFLHLNSFVLSALLLFAVFIVKNGAEHTLSRRHTNG